MVAAEINRLKREQCERTKHDSNFSHWKILIGPSDWEDHSKGKEGCTRYRIHNLPQNFGPGVYELGVAVLRSGLGRGIYKLATDPRRVVVVYIGKTDNVRARLQCYGRNGAHLANECTDGSSSPQIGRSLFQEIFSQGFPIVFRWAPMQSEEDALRAEAQLLTTFDYAWNTSSNGTRRPDDILQMLNKISSSTRKFSDVAKLLLPFTQKQVGIPIKSSKLALKDNKSDEANNSSYNFLSRVFKFNRSRPRIVQTTGGIIEENAKICGVMLADGSICRRPPAEKRVRCPEHKGMRTNVSTVKTIGAPKSESDSLVDNDYRYQNVSHDVKDPLKTVVDNPVVDEIISNTNICEIILDDGSICRSPPVEKTVRYPEHEGMRTNVSTVKTIREPKSESDSLVDNDYRYQNVCHDVEDPSKTVLKVENHVDEIITNTNICGIILDDGSICRKPPAERVRCPEHKEMRINVTKAKAITAPKSESDSTIGNAYSYQNVSHDIEDPSKIVVENPVVDEIINNTNICGIILDDGSICRRPPVEKRVRCPEHKGMRINVNKAKAIRAPKSESESSISNSYSYQNVRHDENPVDEIITNTNICGIILDDGSICRRPPVEKRVRCPQHKGMRINVNKAKALRAPKSESESSSIGNAYSYQNVRHDENPVDELVSNTNICGIILDDGSICRRPPVEKRVRCPEHKGMRINLNKAKAIRAPKSESESTIGNAYSYQNDSHDENICGIILDDGSTCRRQPVKGRKRCLEHKGKRIRASMRVNQI